MVLRKLGRGLDSLIEETRSGPDGPTGTVETARIAPNPFQPREEIDEEALAELTESIREHGLLQPVLVRPVDGGHELVVGERRWRAALRLGMGRIPAVIRQVSDDRMLEIALVENLQREDLHPMEKARAYARYVREMGLTHEEAAKRLGKDRSTVTNQLRLLELSEDLQQMVSRGTLSMGHARALLGLADDDMRRELAGRIEKKGISVRETERLVRGERQEKKAPPVPTPRSAYFVDLERRMRERFATKVRLDGGREKGKITLEYYTQVELEGILEKLLPDFGSGF